VDRGLPNDVLEPQEYSKFAENEEKRIWNIRQEKETHGF
jgi:hypothetical protein